MSNHDSEHDPSNEPRFDTWLAVTGSSVIPASVALAAPPEFFIPLCVSSAFLFVTGLVILKRQDSRRSRASEPRWPAERSAATELQLED